MNDTDKQEKQQQQQQQPKPRDGPAITFEADPLVSDIFACDDGDYFGLVLVSNWPINPSVDETYQEFVRAVKSCFESRDLATTETNETTKTTPDSSLSSLPSVYVYPTIHLHITLATFVRPTKVIDSVFSKPEVRDALRTNVMNLVRSARDLPEWPQQPLRLVVDSGQIGTRAGILLWKDLSGGVAAIRNCVRKAAAEQQRKAAEAEGRSSSDDTANDALAPSIPGIIHSTFMRFASVPSTPGTAVQAAFRSRVVEKIGTEFFGTPNDENKTPLVVQANTVSLVCESTPYMHIPNDDEHILWSCELAKGE